MNSMQIFCAKFVKLLTLKFSLRSHKPRDENGAINLNFYKNRSKTRCTMYFPSAKVVVLVALCLIIPAQLAVIRGDQPPPSEEFEPFKVVRGDQPPPSDEDEPFKVVRGDQPPPSDEDEPFIVVRGDQPPPSDEDEFEPVTAHIALVSSSNTLSWSLICIWAPIIIHIFSF